MDTAPQELLKEHVQSQHFTSTAEIMTAMAGKISMGCGSGNMRAANSG